MEWFLAMISTWRSERKSTHLTQRISSPRSNSNPRERHSSTMFARESRIRSWEVNRLLATINNAYWSMQSWKTTRRVAKITSGTTISPYCRRRQAWLAKKHRTAASWRTISSKTLQRPQFLKDLASKARHRGMGRIEAQIMRQRCMTTRRLWAQDWTKFNQTRGSQKVPATRSWRATTSQLTILWLSAQWAYTVTLSSSYSRLLIKVIETRFFLKALILTAKRSKEAPWLRLSRRPSRLTSSTTHRCASSSNIWLICTDGRYLR